MNAWAEVKMVVSKDITRTIRVRDKDLQVLRRTMPGMSDPIRFKIVVRSSLVNVEDFLNGRLSKKKVP